LADQREKTILKESCKKEEGRKERDERLFVCQKKAPPKKLQNTHNAQREVREREGNRLGVQGEGPRDKSIKREEGMRMDRKGGGYEKGHWEHHSASRKERKGIWKNSRMCRHGQIYWWGKKEKRKTSEEGMADLKGRGGVRQETRTKTQEGVNRNVTWREKSVGIGFQ